VLAFVALWPTKGVAEGVMTLGAVAAIALLVRARFAGGTRLLSREAWALTTVLFAAYWLPEAVSALDAVDVPRALREAAADLRYLPFLWLAAAAVANADARARTFRGLAVIAAIWCFDALLQAASGTSPLAAALDTVKQGLTGKPLCPPDEAHAYGRITGIFSDCNPKLGQVLASLSPFVLHEAARRFRAPGWLFAAAAIGFAIVLAGSRASWITYGLVLVLSGWRLLGWKRLLGVFAFGAVALAVLAVAVPAVQERIERTTQALTASPSGVDSALSGRSRIWSAAVCMAREHPVNGVGARGFREAFPACDPQPGAPAEWGEGPALHAHQVVLEVASETGGFGLLLWLAGAALAWRAWRYADTRSRIQARPAALALVATVFPLNTHLAFYSTFWGGLTLMLCALYAGSLLDRDRVDAPEPGAR
jgi:O-antigen ligase